MAGTVGLDRAAIGASGACILHCLALPVLAASLPFAAFFAEAEWFHVLMALITIAVSLTVVLSAGSTLTASFLLAVFVGMALVALGLFAEGLGLSETILTAVGGSFIAAAHLSRLRRGSPHIDHAP
ncbi:MAG: MerC domain-containing protein [Erythrobacter sp.]|uniref:MerC domain-containing protein n=1 Tax=Erythrobacter sp. TaxID=1042 RepID=UPI001B2706FD|nr:MerC domain-containing protein [Erythrobacter sp.]MBO6767936.1 MerC domain-containing protein [Erythrobacter sp.]